MKNQPKQVKDQIKLWLEYQPQIVKKSLVKYVKL